jgi:hypothetical protein
MKVKKFEKATEPGYPSRRQFAECRALFGVVALGLGSTALMANPSSAASPQMEGDLDYFDGGLAAYPPLPEGLRSLPVSPPPLPLALKSSEIQITPCQEMPDKALTWMPSPSFPSYLAFAFYFRHGLVARLSIVDDAIVVVGQPWPSVYIYMDTIRSEYYSHMWELGKIYLGLEQETSAWTELLIMPNITRSLEPDSFDIADSTISRLGKPLPSLAEVVNPPRSEMSGRLPGLTAMEPRYSAADDPPSDNEVETGGSIAEAQPLGQLPPIPSTDPSTAPSEKEVSGHTGPGYGWVDSGNGPTLAPLTGKDVCDHSGPEYGWVDSGNGPAFLTTTQPLPVEIKINSVQETPASPLAELPLLEEIVIPPQVSAADMTMGTELVGDVGTFALDSAKEKTLPAIPVFILSREPGEIKFELRQEVPANALTRLPSLPEIIMAQPRLFENAVEPQSNSENSLWTVPPLAPVRSLGIFANEPRELSPTSKKNQPSPKP